MFAVVKFLEENSVEVVPDCWCENDNICQWPPKKAHGKYFKGCKPPKVDWERYSIKTYHKGLSLARARELCVKAEFTSDVTDTDELGRGKRKILKNIPSDDEDDSEESPPKRPKTSSKKLEKSKHNPIKLPQPPVFLIPDSTPKSPAATPTTESSSHSPSHSSTHALTVSPSHSPSYALTVSPSHSPGYALTGSRNHSPTQLATHAPTGSSSHSPSRALSGSPSQSPSHFTTHAPTEPSHSLTLLAESESPSHSAVQFSPKLPTDALILSSSLLNKEPAVCDLNTTLIQLRSNLPESINNIEESFEKRNTENDEDFHNAEVIDNSEAATQEGDSRKLRDPKHIEEQRPNLEQSKSISTITPNKSSDNQNESHQTGNVQCTPRGSLSLSRTPIIPKISAARNEDKFQKAVLSMLSDLNVKVDLIQKVLADNFSSPFDMNVQDLPTLPLKTEENIEEFEKFVSSSEEKRNKTVIVLSSWGGKKLNDSVRRILVNIISPELAVSVNWSGANGKVAMKHLTLRKLIIEAIRKNPRTKLAKEYDIEQVIQTWLRHSGERIGAKKDLDQNERRSIIKSKISGKSKRDDISQEESNRSQSSPSYSRRGQQYPTEIRDLAEQIGSRMRGQETNPIVSRSRDPKPKTHKKRYRSQEGRHQEKPSKHRRLQFIVSEESDISTS